MSQRRFALAWPDHVAGVACAVAVFYRSGEITTALSGVLARVLEGLAGGSRIYFVGGVYGLRVAGAAAGLAVLGLVVVVFDRLLATGHLRAWAPPLAVLTAAIAVLVPILRSAGAAPNEAVVLGVSLATLLALGFTAWWCGGLLCAGIRRRVNIHGARLGLSGRGHR